MSDPIVERRFSGARRFVQSDYGRRLCDQCNVQPMIGSSNVVGVMFESVRLVDAKLVVMQSQTCRLLASTNNVPHRPAAAGR